MGYSLNFHSINLHDAQKEMKELQLKNEQEGHEILSSVINEKGVYEGQIEHSTGAGALFEEYISSIASDYFSEENLLNLMMKRDDVFPFVNGVEWGYLTYNEIENYLGSCKNKDESLYFEDNDDFEDDLDTLQEIFEIAANKKSDLICLYY